MGPIRGRTVKSKSDRQHDRHDSSETISETTSMGGEDRTRKDPNGMMDEKRCVDKELDKIKEQVIVEYDIKAAKTPEERQKAEHRADKMERDAELQCL